jgi:hypothetical protein
MKGKLTKYLMNIFRSASIFFKSIAGIQAPKREMQEFNDKEYAILTDSEIESASQWAYDMMVENGIVVENYMTQKLDCDDFCLIFKAFFTIACMVLFPDKKGGTPVGLYGYTRRKDKVRHMVLEFIRRGQTTQFREGFPHRRDIKKLTASEQESNDLRYF